MTSDEKIELLGEAVALLIQKYEAINGELELSCSVTAKATDTIVALHGQVQALARRIDDVESDVAYLDRNAA